MKQNRQTSRSDRRTTPTPAALELTPDRAFVPRLDVRARPPRWMAGRVEHITSGRVTPVTSLREQLVFLAEVLRKDDRGERQTANATLVLGTRESDVPASVQSTVDEAAGVAAAQPILRGRNRREES